MLEKHIEAAVCRYAESKGFVQYKFSSPAHFGVPDRIFFGDLNCVFLIEFKRKGGKPTPAQDREHARLRERGVLVYVVDTVEDGYAMVDRHALA